MSSHETTPASVLADETIPQERFVGMRLTFLLTVGACERGAERCLRGACGDLLREKWPYGRLGEHTLAALRPKPLMVIGGRVRLGATSWLSRTSALMRIHV